MTAPSCEWCERGFPVRIGVKGGPVFHRAPGGPRCRAKVPKWAGDDYHASLNRQLAYDRKRAAKVKTQGKEAQ